MSNTSTLESPNGSIQLREVSNPEYGYSNAQTSYNGNHFRVEILGQPADAWWSNTTNALDMHEVDEVSDEEFKFLGARVFRIFDEEDADLM